MNAKVNKYGKVLLWKGLMSRLRRLFRNQEFGVFMPLLIIILITGIFNPDFLKLNNFTTIFKIIPFIAIVALGESFVLMTGNVDISVGRASGFAGIFFAYLMIVSGVHWIPAMLIVLVVGALVGLINGFFGGQNRYRGFHHDYRIAVYGGWCAISLDKRVSALAAAVRPWKVWRCSAAWIILAVLDHGSAVYGCTFY